MAVPDVTEVRHPIDVDAVTKYLSQLNGQTPEKSTLGVDIPKFSNQKYGIKQFSFGQSNPTYLLQDGDRKFVLRRKPSPNNKLVSKSAHAIEREFFILRAINVLNKENTRQVAVPQVYILCEDESIIGFVFYIMEYIEGDQIKNPDMPGVSDADKELLWKSIMETSSAIHLLDGHKLIAQLPKSHFPQFHDLARLSKSSYFQRQVRTLSNVEKLQSETVAPIPNFAGICKWTLDHAPKDPTHLSLIHGDFKIDNVLFDPKTRKVKAVLDWELCTFGHPLFDLANFLQPFQTPNKLNQLMYSDPETDIGRENEASLKNIQKRLRQYHEAYGAPSWDPKDSTNNAIDLWRLGCVFGLVRLCVISQGIAMRVKKGSASGNAAGFSQLYLYLYTLAEELIEEDNTKKAGSKF